MHSIRAWRNCLQLFLFKIKSASEHDEDADIKLDTSETSTPVLDIESKLD
jgi:hypothetical protein